MGLAPRARRELRPRKERNRKMKIDKIGMRKVVSANRVSGWVPYLYAGKTAVFAAESYIAKSGHDLPAAIAGAVKAGNIARAICRAADIAEALHAKVTAVIADNLERARAACDKTDAAKKAVAEWVAANTETEEGEPMSVAAAREAGLIPAELETALKDAAKAETKTAKKIDLATVYNRGC